MEVGRERARRGCLRPIRVAEARLGADPHPVHARIDALPDRNHRAGGVRSRDLAAAAPVLAAVVAKLDQVAGDRRAAVANHAAHVALRP